MRQLKITNSITNRNALLEKYFQEIGKEKILTVEEEVELAVRIKLGDHEAFDKLVRSNLRFVVSVAKQYQNQGLGLSDLINEGNLGLIKAAQRFDSTRGFKFISYGVWWIRQGILQALAEQSRIVRLPLNRLGAINRINKAFTSLEQDFEREPSFEEVSLYLEIKEEDVEELNRYNAGRHVSMDAPLVGDEISSMLDIYVDDNSDTPIDGLIRESLAKEVQRSLSTLSPKERDVINLYFGIGVPHSLTLEEIAKKFDLTRERVRQIKEKAIRRLKHNTRSRLLKPYLG
ncbi:MAG: RNA polymerase sigma factor RpoD/SigA [bacterium]